MDITHCEFEMPDQFGSVIMPVWRMNLASEE